MAPPRDPPPGDPGPIIRKAAEFSFRWGDKYRALPITVRLPLDLLSLVFSLALLWAVLRF